MTLSVDLTPSGRLLVDLLSTAVCDLDRAQGPRPRRGRKRATFTENELRAHIRRTVLSPMFRAELQAADDVLCGATSGQRRIDYACIDPTICVLHPPLRVVAATCELKGPARPTIWKPNANNWYEQIKRGEPFGIKSEVLKQHERLKRSPQTEHYVFWIIENPDHGELINSALARLLGRLHADLPFVGLTECFRKDVDGLWLFLFRLI